MIASWTVAHCRELPFPRHWPSEPQAHGYAPLVLAPLNAPILSETEIWAMLRLLPPCGRSRELDTLRP
jgi:hypothetical protein